MMHATSLQTLLLKAQNGDLDALAQLITRFEPLIKACSSGLSEYDRDDLEQELRLHLFLLIKRFPDLIH